MNLRDLAVAGVALVLVLAIAVTALVRGAQEPSPAERVADAERRLMTIREMERPATPGECRELRDDYEEARLALASMPADTAPAADDVAPLAAEPEAGPPADSASLAERLVGVAAFLAASCE